MIEKWLKIMVHLNFIIKLFSGQILVFWYFYRCVCKARLQGTNIKIMKKTVRMYLATERDLPKTLYFLDIRYNARSHGKWMWYTKMTYSIDIRYM